MSTLLSIANLHVSTSDTSITDTGITDTRITDTSILKGVTLTIMPGQTHAIMGPNGSGKSTLAKTLMGHPAYRIEQGDMRFNGISLQDMSPSERSKAGIFLAFQSPLAIEGVSIRDFLYQAYIAHYPQASTDQFETELIQHIKLLHIKPAYLERSLNFGFSGGEKKKIEILQMAMLKPKLVLLDEIDSGLDVDALKIVCAGINHVKEQNPDMALLLITHYPRILHYIVPDVVHVMDKGIITQSGDTSLAENIEQSGYN